VQRQKTVQKELEPLLEKSNLNCRQRAKVNWLRSGDRNTKYFHACANYWRKSNTIYAIFDVDGKYCSSEEEVQLAFVNYFVGLFMSESVGNVMPCLQLVNC
jgi:hypothetical protein